MKRRPLTLYAVSAVFIAIALSFPLQIMWLYGHGISEIGAILHKLTLFNWFVITGLVAVACMVYEASARLRYALPALVGLVALNNFFVAYLGTDYSPWTASFATLGFVALSLPLASKEVRILLENPERRWWRIAKREFKHLPVILNGLRNQKLRGETFDISETGMFFPLREDAGGMKMDQKVSICLSLSQFTQLKCEGRIVRHAEPRGVYPSGIGIQFVDLSAEQKADLRRAIYSR